jgi:hypothetical protein
MKGKWFEIALVLIVLLIGPCTASWAQEKKTGIFSITPAFTFSWYPYATFHEDASANTDTEVDVNNFGMSAMMSLKLFDKVGANVDLKIDDPAFRKLVDIAGYLTAYYFMLKFDYHSFGGTVRWAGNPSYNPIPNGLVNFRNQWTTVSLLFRVDELALDGEGFFSEYLRLMRDYLFLGGQVMGAVGIGYARFDMPLAYQTQPSSGLLHPGFGLVKGEVWGFEFLWDTLSKTMERSAAERSSWLWLQHIWVYIDWFWGLPPFGVVGSGEIDAKAVKWMSDKNGVSVDGNISNLHYGVVHGILGYQNVWDIGKTGKIGLAVGVELLEENIKAHSDDILIDYWSWHIGPTVRVCASW